LGGAFIAANPAHQLSGGFRVQALDFQGRLASPNTQSARLGARSIIGQFHGASDHIELAMQADAPKLEVSIAQARTLALNIDSLSANVQFGQHWRIDGRFNQGALNDPALPGAVSAMQGRWSALPGAERALIRVDAAEALLTAARPRSAAELPLFHPLRITDFQASLARGRINAQGGLALAEGVRPLAHFAAQHDINAGAGSAHVVADALNFGPQLQPYDISELARGMLENVRGPASAEATIGWNSAHIAGAAVLRLDGVSLSTGTIPIIQDVRGDVRFDDLFALTTPPHQHLHVGLVDPGIAVNNGDIEFQLLAHRQVRIERADFEFASGKLSVTPTTIELGADATPFELTLRDVDAAALIATLNIPDVAATGRVEGRFPLLLTRRRALVENGLLASQGDGGSISYLGGAGAGASGMARVAFEALRSFHYDNLRLTLNGDLDGDIVSQIQFTGHNSGKPLDLGPIANLPGVGPVSVRGVPFKFNVQVSAPFRSLANTVAAIVDPTRLLRDNQSAPSPGPVDQTRPSPR